MRRFFPFAALLGVAFVLGCQDVGTGPDGLEPQFNKPADDPNDPDAKAACEAPGGFIFDEKGHCHAGEDAADPNLFDLSVKIFSVQLTDPTADPSENPATVPVETGGP